MNDNIDRYEILSEPDKRGYVIVKRLADGKTAPCKAIRMTMLDWETKTEELTNE